MSFEKIQFILITALTGFVVSFLITFLGIKISKFLIIVGIILFVVFYLFINGSFDLGFVNIKGIFITNLDRFGNQIYNLKEMLIKNIPLTIGIIAGAIYGFKKAI
ncbi:MAG: hypothetical protein COW71_13660 [Ignavibacteriales bacterium CG18_big_fil_WC_8_21_14_2_50_31_20]|nr:MAG: hypothetical protein COW71_13660 [Ignavibacteriales bacterium CG18_big_fil_WC_8_21_14_2_50_31_20]